ncbi:uracil phosphoribosyltransferase [Arcobacter suis]|uniref:Uracil phosphoribosyltransferase n=1 Tax=Arcobacter suis CECT 7833 TaxID=663365 RepID=A0AAD0SR87_9BACT|nr:uracil phosphoribosyltransferase [Arcobacter suis]AXX90204.1 uracil phosphoribosyltransferase [Arcobacter suis CECT 7833]RWS45694.1 uracil phosphoribosyltransferase [Arcobacter suis]
MYKESTNVVVKHLVNKLRNINTTSSDFRLTIEEISKIIASEALNDFETTIEVINTWQGLLDVKMIEVQKLVLISILRAAEPMLNGILKTFPDAKSGFLGMKRDEQTSLSRIFYENIPNLENKTVLLLDPMLATGGSLIHGITHLKTKNPKRIISLNIIGSPYGVKKVQEIHPDVDIFIAQIDQKLDENNYIIPGLGDAGDRAFNTN